MAARRSCASRSCAPSARVKSRVYNAILNFQRGKSDQKIVHWKRAKTNNTRRECRRDRERKKEEKATRKSCIGKEQRRIRVANEEEIAKERKKESCIIIIEFFSATEKLPAQINKNYYYILCFYEYLTRHVPALALVGVERGDRRLSVLFARASSSSFFYTTAFKSSSSWDDDVNDEGMSKK